MQDVASKRGLLPGLGKGASHSGSLLTRFAVNLLFTHEQITVMDELLEVLLREEVALLQAWNSVLGHAGRCAGPVLPYEAALVRVINHSVLPGS